MYKHIPTDLLKVKTELFTSIHLQIPEISCMDGYLLSLKI